MRNSLAHEEFLDKQAVRGLAFRANTFINKALTWPWSLERSTTMESTTTSLQAVPREPRTTAAVAVVGESTTVAIADQDRAPAHHAHIPNISSIIHNAMVCAENEAAEEDFTSCCLDLRRLARVLQAFRLAALLKIKLEARQHMRIWHSHKPCDEETLLTSKSTQNKVGSPLVAKNGNSVAQKAIDGLHHPWRGSKACQDCNLHDGSSMTMYADSEGIRTDNTEA